MVRKSDHIFLLFRPPTIQSPPHVAYFWCPGLETAGMNGQRVNNDAAAG